GAAEGAARTSSWLGTAWPGWWSLEWQREPDRLAHLVYLDADVPRDGESSLDCNGLRGDARAAFVARAESDGRLRPRPREHPWGITQAEDAAWVNSKMTPHPIKAFSDPVRVMDAD